MIPGSLVVVGFGNERQMSVEMGDGVVLSLVDEGGVLSGKNAKIGWSVKN